MRTREKLLLLLTIVGFVVPNVMIVVFSMQHGVSPGRFLGNVFATLPASQFTMDLAISFVSFVAWTAWDGPRTGVPWWWVTIPASLLVGLCFAIPLYLLLRERATRKPMPTLDISELPTPTPPSRAEPLGH